MGTAMESNLDLLRVKESHNFMTVVLFSFIAMGIIFSTFVSKLPV